MIQLTAAQITVNNEVIPHDPNSVSWTEGFGETKMRAASTGEGDSEQVYAQDIESQYSTVKFTMPTTPETIALARAWKANKNQNVIAITGSTVDGDVRRTFTQAALVNDYEVQAGTETSIELEFKTNKAR